MPMKKLTLKPGVNLEASPTANQFQLAASNLIRFYGGFVEKLGGWVQLATQTFVGTCRGLHGWADVIGLPYLAIGTDQRLQLLDGGNIVDITPLISTTNPAVSFSTTISQPIVTITDAGYNPSAGDWINLQTQVSVGGLILFGFYQVQTVPTGTTYTITTGGPLATSTVTNGGAVPSYTTANTLPTVHVTLANHGLVTGDIFNAAVSTTVATVVISGIYNVTVTGANTFDITAGSNANATTTASENGGNARIEYLIPVGPSVNTPLTGYGAGDYGAGDYGGSSGGATILALRQWSLDNFGQDLIASPTNGKIYFWQPPTVQPASVVSGSAPLQNTAVFCIPQAQIIMALGAEVGGTQQPLLVRWCDAADFTDWNATATNQAGSYSIPSGSGLVGGFSTSLGSTIWTDEDVWSVTYLGFPLVFGFNNVGPGCGLVSMRAVGIVGTSFAMWLGLHQFYRYNIGGGVQPIECSVWDFYFNNVDLTQTGQIHCAVNTVFNEMAWHFPLSPSSPLWNALTPMGYVKFNYVEQVWDYGLSSQYQRTAWAGHSPMGNPIGSDLAGLLQQHERGFDANGVSMAWSWQSGYFDDGEGEEFIFSDMLIPDFVTIGGPTITPTIYTQGEPNDPPLLVVTSQFSTTTPFITYSARGRQMSIGMQSSGSDLGTSSRLGAIRVRFQPDGRN